MGRHGHPSSTSSSCAASSLLPRLLVAAALVWCHGSLLLVATAQPSNAPPGQVQVQVRVGVLLNLAWSVGQRRKVGIEMAVEDYYAAYPGSRTRVDLRFADYSFGDAVGAASAAVDLIKNQQVQAIIGPTTSAEAEFAAHIGNSTHVPVVSYSATSPALSPSQTPFFVRTVANDSYQAAPVAAILASFSWHAAVVVYEDSPYGSGILPALADALQGVGARIMERQAVPTGATDDRIDATLNRFMAMPTRVFVVHMNPGLAVRFFRRARVARMMSEGYAWVVTDGVGGVVDTMPPEDVRAMEGVVSLRPYVRETEQVRNFSARFRARLRRVNATADDYTGDATATMLWSYDTAWAIAAAAEAAGVSGPAFQTPQRSAAGTDLDRLGVSATGAALLGALRRMTFPGLAGNFSLVDGQLQPPPYEVINVVGRGARPVGFWTPETGISQDLESSNSNGGKGLKSILWPGDSMSPPRGWVVSPNGQKLRVAVPVKGGFKQFVNVAYDSNSTTGKPNITGYCIDVFDAVMHNMPYPVSYEYVPQGDSSLSYDNFVKLVPDKVADVIVGDVTITASRMDRMDFSMPFTESGWSMVVAVRTEPSSSMWIFLQPLTTGLWLASLAFFCFTGFVVWAIEHRINPEFRGTPWQQFGLIFYFAFSTLVFSHKEKLESNLSRFVVTIWVFVVLILTSSYTASLTSMLTVQKLQPTVTDVRELQRSGAQVGFQDGSFIEASLQKLGFDRSRMVNYSTAEQYAEALSSGRVAAVFDEIPYLKLFLSQYCDGGFARVGPIYKTDGFGFVFPRGSPLTPDVSRAVLGLAEGEDMAQIEKKWFGEPGACLRQDGTVPVGSSNLSFRSFGGLFLITGVVSGLMLLVYIVTFVLRERGEVRDLEEAGGSGSPSLRRLRAWLRHYDRKDLRSPTFKTWNEESVRDGSRTPRWDDDTVRNGGRRESAIGMSPISISAGSDMINVASSPASELGTSFEQRMQEAETSVEMPKTMAS